MMNRQLSILSGMLAVVAAIAACNTEQGGEEVTNDRSRLVAVETVTIIPDSFDDYIRLSGTVEAHEDATISAENSGRILSILERGSTVGEGDIIARMDDSLMRARYEAARTSYELAEDTYSRLVPLHEEAIISTQDLRSAAAQRDQARAQLDQAEKQLRDASVAAPFGGRVEERFVRTGELINPGMPIIRLVNTDRIRITAGIPERYSGQISEGSPAVVRFRSYDGSSIEGSITFAGNVIDATTRTFPIEIELGNPDGSIRPEMVVDIQVRRRTVENAVVIPRTAIVRDEGGTNVFVSRQDGEQKRAELIAVTPGMASGPVIEIREGLQEGDEVVISGMRTLSAGDRLNVLRNINSNEKALDLQNMDRPVNLY